MVYTTDFTLESGPEDAPSCITVTQDYSYRGPTPDSWTEPGDAPEVELDGSAYYVEDGVEIQLSLVLKGEEGFIEQVINDPPDDDYYPEDY